MMPDKPAKQDGIIEPQVETKLFSEGSIARTPNTAPVTVSAAMPLDLSVVEAPEYPTDEALPRSIGRYQIERTLGQGGYGCVYLAFDDELQRHVTVKVPHRYRVQAPEDLQSFLAEARMLAKLEHPNVVPVHDVGNTPDGICYIVSRFIDGSDLYHHMQSSSLSIGEAVELVATIAEAPHYVHL